VSTFDKEEYGVIKGDEDIQKVECESNEGEIKELYHRKRTPYCIPVLINRSKNMVAPACKYFEPVNEGCCADI